MRVFFVALLVGVLASTTSAHPPVAGPGTIVASGLAGPEGIAFTRDGRMLVGTQPGDILVVAPDGTSSVLATVDPSPAGLTVLRDGRIVVGCFSTDTVWSIDPDSGFPSILATGVDGPNFIVQERGGRLLASASFAGTIVDLTSGTATTLASGFVFPNGLALGRDRWLYVAETLPGRVMRLRRERDGTLGAPEEYATGMPIIDGIAFDRAGNLLAVGSDTLFVIDAKTRAVSPLSTDPVFDWPATIAFGRGRTFGRKNMYLTNFGPAFGNGTSIVRVPYNHAGGPLAR